MLFTVHITIIINNKFSMPWIFENLVELPHYSNYIHFFQEGHKYGHGGRLVLI